MLNDASSFNRRQLDKRIHERQAMGRSTFQDRMASAPMHNGKPLTELTSEEIVGYMGMDAPRPKIIKTKRPE
jgi:hypothetical protein